jgi:hypothetical protein
MNIDTGKYRFKKEDIGVFNTKSSDAAVSNFGNDCRIVGLTMGEYSLIDIIHSILKKTGQARVIIATWSAGIKDAFQVKWMCESNLITDLKLLTDHSYKTRQSKYAASIEDLFGKENIRTSEMHAKFVLIQNNDYKVAIISSMNLNANKTCEIFQIEEGSGVFDMLMDFSIHHFENMEPGFVSSSTKVNETVSNFFNKYEHKKESNKHWSEI